MRKLDIDLLRVLAISLVVFAHTTNMPMGAIGVQIFFLVSGYLLADFGKRFSGGKFVLYRFARLFPLCLLMSLIFYFRFNSFHWFVGNIFMIQTLFSNYVSFPGGWSISYEWIFSLLIATGLITKFKSVRFAILLVSLISQIYLFNLDAQLSNLFPYTILIIVANLFYVTLGISFRMSDFNSLNLKKGYFLILLIIVLYFSPKNPPFPLYQWSLMVFCLAILILENDGIKKLARLRGLSIIHHIGSYTYGIFCAHFIVMIGLENLKIDGLTVMQYLQIKFSIFGLFTHFLIVFVISYNVARLSYLYIERPIVIFASRKLSKV